MHAWSCLRTELIWIYDHEPAPGSRQATFDHRGGNWAWYLRTGEVRVTGKGGSRTARAGQWMLLSRDVHRQEFSDDASLISVCFLCQWPAGSDVFLPQDTVVLDGCEHPALAKTAVQLERLVRRHFAGSHWLQTSQVAGYPLFLRFQRAFLGWLEAWFEARLANGARLSRHPGDARALRAVQFLDDADLAAPLPRAALASAIGLSDVQLNRLFRQQFQVTPVQYWDYRRLEFARRCLETSDTPLKELAARLGFRSASHFSVWFRRHAGMPPGRYRVH